MHLLLVTLKNAFRRRFTESSDFKCHNLSSDTILSPSLQPACKSLFRTIFQQLHTGQVFIPSQETAVSRNKKGNHSISLIFSITYLLRDEKFFRSVFVNGHALYEF